MSDLGRLHWKSLRLFGSVLFLVEVIFGGGIGGSVLWIGKGVGDDVDSVGEMWLFDCAGEIVSGVVISWISVVMRVFGTDVFCGREELEVWRIVEGDERLVVVGGVGTYGSVVLLLELVEVMGFGCTSCSACLLPTATLTDLLEGLRKSILSGPYVPSTVLVQAVAATECNPAIQQHTTIETVLNMTPENKEHFLSEKEAIFLLLTGNGDDYLFHCLMLVKPLMIGKP
ncbi:hypothetical protein Tco_1215013 [Tanacetum coccineum]